MEIGATILHRSAHRGPAGRISSVALERQPDRAVVRRVGAMTVPLRDALSHSDPCITIWDTVVKAVILNFSWAVVRSRDWTLAPWNWTGIRHVARKTRLASSMSA